MQPQSSETAAMPNARVDRLSPQERLALIGQLWDSLDDADLAVTAAQQAELERRLASLAEDRDAAVTWEKLRDELRQRRR
jgi:putative addiction module component (TIGR02574 family)